ncbi:chaplin family protein [Nonomuraea sp. NPDC049684]|uniref:chaplin family protein n=1 Tax=Nonomuraea sp. NPDC049684 TaxID=3364356 RepID=UPI00379C4C0F
MRTWARASTPAALLAVAVMSFGSGAAFADTSGNSSVGGGNQVNLPINLPIDISGNAVGAAGQSSAGSQGGASVENAGPSDIPNRTSGNSSVLGGNQVNAPITAPLNACGNAVSLFGKSDAGCRGGATVHNKGKGGAGGNQTSGDSSLIGGNQLTAPITAPINACGNALAIFGDATAGCKGGASVHNSGVGNAGGNRTSGRSSALGGNQVIAPVNGPINICGNAVAVFGRAFAGCQGGASVTNSGGGGWLHHMAAPGSTGNDTDGRYGAGSGNQVIAPANLPITACGNAVGNAVANCRGGATVLNTRAGSGAGGNTTSGRSGVLSGNQVIAPITAPLNVCGNAVAAFGKAFAGCRGVVSVKNGGRGAGGNHTSGQSGVGAGNQAVAPITAPLNVCGNAAAVLGASTAHCKGGAAVWPHNGVGGGGNTTSGRSGVLSGNQVIAPITAPVNVCGNAVAVLGDAAAGCLGGAHVGKPGYPGGGYSQFLRSTGHQAAAKSGLLPAVPAVPALNGVNGTGGVPGLPDVGGLSKAGGLPVPGNVTQQLQGSGLPVPGNVTQQLQGSGLPVGGGLSSLPLVDDASKTLGLPALPELPGLPGQAQAPVQGPAQARPGAVDMPAKSWEKRVPVRPGKRHMADRTDHGRRAPARPSSPLAPATDLLSSTPVGGAVTSATGGLPVGNLGLMSAAQPAGLTGMNSSSLLALLLGSMFAASATLFATARRFRFGRK